MPSNIEIKARASDWDEQLKRAESLAGSPPKFTRQTDTFFVAPSGRLKLRLFEDHSGELISYKRQDTSGPKSSDYVIASLQQADEVLAVLSHSLETVGTVKKLRRVFWVGHTRIHFDEVETLGRFLELEYVLVPGENPDTGDEEVLRLLGELGVRPEDHLNGAYVDMLRSK